MDENGKAERSWLTQPPIADPPAALLQFPAAAEGAAAGKDAAEKAAAEKAPANETADPKAKPKHHQVDQPIEPS